MTIPVAFPFAVPALTIHEQHDLLLQTLGRIGELPHITEAKYGVNLSPVAKQVHRRVSSLYHAQISTDNACSGLPESHAHKASDLGDCPEEKGRLETIISLVVDLKRTEIQAQGIQADLSHKQKHPLLPKC